MGSPQGPPSHKEIERTWKAAYGEKVAAHLRADQRYSIVRVGESVLAFSDYDGYVLAMRDAWDSGLVPESGPVNVLGWSLPESVPVLHAVDPRAGNGNGPDQRPAN